MNELREKLLDELINKFGCENPLVIQYAEQCEYLSDNDFNNKALKYLAEYLLALEVTDFE